MDLNLTHEVATLKRMSAPSCGDAMPRSSAKPTGANNKPWLIERIAWRLQALAEGDLSERARQRAAELANNADLRTLPTEDLPHGPRPGPRSVTTAGSLPGRQPSAAARHDPDPPVQGPDAPGAGDAGRLRSSRARSSARCRAVAKAITGSHCNGFLFFRLTQQGGNR